MFDETAKLVAENISNQSTKSTQIRGFYDYIVKLEQDAQIQDFSEILPFVKMLNSKAAYSQSRGHASYEFVKMINKCVEQVKTKEDLRVFKLFFEAVIGFSQKVRRQDENFNFKRTDRAFERASHRWWR
ncbi:MAG: type III-A CRISPR-associated protein Csm2 [Wolinella sp.]